MVVSSGASIINSFKLNLVITNLIKTQIFESLVMFGCGMVIALLYGVFTRHIKIYIKNKIIAATYEVLFWFFSGILTCQFLYYCSYGEINVHSICAFVCGVFLWKFLFYATMSMGDGKCLNKRKEEAERTKTLIK